MHACISKIMVANGKNEGCLCLCDDIAFIGFQSLINNQLTIYIYYVLIMSRVVCSFILFLFYMVCLLILDWLESFIQTMILFFFFFSQGFKSNENQNQNAKRILTCCQGRQISNVLDSIGTIFGEIVTQITVFFQPEKLIRSFIFVCVYQNK